MALTDMTYIFKGIECFCGALVPRNLAFLQPTNVYATDFLNIFHIAHNGSYYDQRCDSVTVLHACSCWCYCAAFSPYKISAQ